MNVWSTRIMVGAVAAALAAFAGVTVLFEAASAQTPTPTPSPAAAGPPCPNYLDLATVPVDDALSPTLTAKWDERLNGIELTWSVPRPANCAFFQVRESSAGYSGSGSIKWAEWILAAGSGVRFSPASAPTGTRCYRLFALSWAGRSEGSESCAEIPPGAVPTPPPPGGVPQPSGTPWPSPTGVQIEGHTILLDENNFPLRPENQAWFVGISWSVLAGFTGTYEVQRARSEPGAPLLWELLRSGQFPASGAVGGRIGFEEQVTPLTIWCFRVRANINRETGPFSEPLCMPRPPSSGGIGSAPGTTTPAPLPPVVGNGPAPATSSQSAPVLAALVGALLGLATAVALRRKR